MCVLSVLFFHSLLLYFDLSYCVEPISNKHNGSVHMPPNFFFYSFSVPMILLYVRENWENELFSIMISLHSNDSISFSLTKKRVHQTTKLKIYDFSL